MKAGIICPYDWSYPGGVKTHISGLAAALRASGREVEIIAPASRPEPDIFAAGRSVGIPFNGSVARLCLSPAATRKVKARLSAGDIDVVHIHEPASPSIGLVALSAAKIPVVATFHAAAARSVPYALARPALWRLFAKISQRIAVSTEARRLVATYFPGEYTLIPNGVDLARYKAARPRDDLRALKPFVLFVGRDEQRKGLGVLIDAMKIVRESADARLVVAGETRRQLPSWAISLGPTATADLPGVYKSADVFCAPSIRGESFGLVLAEAMAAGVPVVCSDLAGYREAAAGAADFFAVGDAAAAASAITAVLGEPRRARDLSAKGAARAARLDWQVLAQDVLSCYNRALS